MREESPFPPLSCTGPSPDMSLETRRYAPGLVVALVVVLAAVAAGLGSASSARGDVYFSGTIPNEWVQNNAWNTYTYNEAVNCYCSGSGPLVGIKQIHTNGQELYNYSARGNIDICHGPDYTRTLCANLSSNSISITCDRITTPC
jgi:hypothetical protein